MLIYCDNVSEYVRDLTLKYHHEGRDAKNFIKVIVPNLIQKFDKKMMETLGYTVSNDPIFRSFNNDIINILYNSPMYESNYSASGRHARDMQNAVFIKCLKDLGVDGFN